jgi:hypothetical protein
MARNSKAEQETRRAGEQESRRAGEQESTHLALLPATGEAVG